MSEEHLTILGLYSTESTRLTMACRSYIKIIVTDDSGMLFEPGVELVEQIDPIVERGFAASIRLFIKEEETVNFRRVVNLLSQFYRSNPEVVTELRNYKRRFTEILSGSEDALDRFWNLNHLHLDIGDERYVRQVNIAHSCMGALEISELFKSIVEFSALFDDLNAAYIKSLLPENRYQSAYYN